ncbi:MAG: hypothetical protein M3O74_13590 [Pseudomonadota bacterium]|nr:hypothetical protein [Pseudomonadota bacterium]
MTYKTFTLGDLRTLLAPLSNTRKQAVFYTLETHGTLENTMILGWKEALRTPATDLAKEIVRAQPRHLRLDYVFWEYLEGGQAAPLFDLADCVKEAAMGRSFELLQVLYDEMVWIDGKAEAEHFVHELMKELL